MESDQMPNQVTPPPAPEEPVKKKRKFSIRGLLLVLLLLVVGGLGYWTFQLNTSLNHERQEVAILNSKYDAMTGRKNALTGELEKTRTDTESLKAETESTNKTIEDTKKETADSKKDIKELKEKMGKAWSYLNVMRGVFEDKDNIIETLFSVLAVDDENLSSLFLNYLRSPTTSNFYSWLGYLLSTAETILSN